MDKVELEIVRADIAMAKARLKANGEWGKGEKFQTQTNRMRAAYAAPPTGCGLPSLGRAAATGLAAEPQGKPLRTFADAVRAKGVKISPEGVAGVLKAAGEGFN